jgi:hypothetical protein
MAKHSEICTASTASPIKPATTADEASVRQPVNVLIQHLSIIVEMKDSGAPAFQGSRVSKSPVV